MMQNLPTSPLVFVQSKQKSLHETYSSQKHISVNKYTKMSLGLGTILVKINSHKTNIKVYCERELEVSVTIRLEAKAPDSSWCDNKFQNPIENLRTNQK
jgi:hypothetical protein